MSNTPRISPTRLPVLTTANLGRQVHFSAVSPRVRVNLTLRRLALEGAKSSPASAPAPAERHAA